NSSSYFSNLFESLSRTNIIETSEKINIELEKLTSTALKITSYGFFDEKKAKQKMKEFSQKSNLPYIKIATELAIKVNSLLDFLR
ncbi:MAG: hypothetical protein KGD64_14820, partial [Candidatus Heimdallarchaeota archaeon]|nr:hypothetical protein [Candidatus Heimdallarchaeota archaeon]